MKISVKRFSRSQAWPRAASRPAPLATARQSRWRAARSQRTDRRGRDLDRAIDAYGARAEALECVSRRPVARSNSRSASNRAMSNGMRRRPERAVELYRAGCAAAFSLAVCSRLRAAMGHVGLRTARLDGVDRSVRPSLDACTSSFARNYGAVTRRAGCAMDRLSGELRWPRSRWDRSGRRLARASPRGVVLRSALQDLADLQRLRESGRQHLAERYRAAANQVAAAGRAGELTRGSSPRNQRPQEAMPRTDGRIGRDARATESIATVRALGGRRSGRGRWRRLELLGADRMQSS